MQSTRRYKTYNEATGAVVAKTYADGREVTYTLTDLGQVATRTDARGIVTTYTYNLYGDVTAIAYSDGTPGVTFTYDSYGRQASATATATGTRALDNPFRFSSEFHEDTLEHLLHVPIYYCHPLQRLGKRLH